MRRFITSAILLPGLLSLPLRHAAAQASTSLPPGRAGDAVRAYFAAVAAADSTKLLAWLKQYDPEGDLTVRIGRQLALARRTGGFTVERMIRGTNTAVEAVVRERKSGERARLTLVLDASGIAEGFGLDAMPPEGAAEQSAPTKDAKLPDQASLLQHVRTYLDSLTAADAFSGVVSISRAGVPLFEQAYGYANRETKTKNTLETRFNLGSINKIFTATAVRQLAAAGRLSLDSTLARAWPDYPNSEVARQVTVRQILNHRSGIMGNIFTVQRGGGPNEIRHNRQIIAALASAPLVFPPGAREEYSNFGYVVLGGLIERVSGADYYDYIQKNIYDPVGMTQSGHFENSALPPGTALGYTRDGGTLHANTALLPGRGSAAGGGYSTIADLKKFLGALRAGSLAGGPPVGLGIAGGAEGINSVVEGSLPGGYDVIVLTNLDPPAAMRVGKQIRGWIGEER